MECDEDSRRILETLAFLIPARARSTDKQPDNERHLQRLATIPVFCSSPVAIGQYWIAGIKHFN
jgi:hypothetical protein